MDSEMTTILEGPVKYRYGRKWKPRWCVIKKPSPVADKVFVLLYKSRRDKLSHAKVAFTQDSFHGTESGFLYDKENHTVAMLYDKNVVLFAFQSREAMIQFEIQLYAHFGEINRFIVRPCAVPAHVKLPLKEVAHIHVRTHQLCVTAFTPPRVLVTWKKSELHRFGSLDGKLVLEPMFFSRKGSGLYIFSTPDADEIVNIFLQSSTNKKDIMRHLSLSSPSQTTGFFLDNLKFSRDAVKRHSVNDEVFAKMRTFSNRNRLKYNIPDPLLSYDVPSAPSHPLKCYHRMNSFDVKRKFSTSLERLNNFMLRSLSAGRLSEMRKDVCTNCSVVEDCFDESLKLTSSLESVFYNRMDTSRSRKFSDVSSSDVSLNDMSPNSDEKKKSENMTLNKECEALEQKLYLLDRLMEKKEGGRSLALTPKLNKTIQNVLQQLEIKHSDCSHEISRSMSDDLQRGKSLLKSLSAECPIRFNGFNGQNPHVDNVNYSHNSEIPNSEVKNDPLSPFNTKRSFVDPFLNLKISQPLPYVDLSKYDSVDPVTQNLANIQYDSCPFMKTNNFASGSVQDSCLVASETPQVASHNSGIVSIESYIKMTDRSLLDSRADKFFSNCSLLPYIDMNSPCEKCSEICDRSSIIGSNGIAVCNINNNCERRTSSSTDTLSKPDSSVVKNELQPRSVAPFQDLLPFSRINSNSNVKLNVNNSNPAIKRSDTERKSKLKSMFLSYFLKWKSNKSKAGKRLYETSDCSSPTFPSKPSSSYPLLACHRTNDLRDNSYSNELKSRSKSLPCSISNDKIIDFRTFKIPFESEKITINRKSRDRSSTTTTSQMHRNVVSSRLSYSVSHKNSPLEGGTYSESIQKSGHLPDQVAIPINCESIDPSSTSPADNERCCQSTGSEHRSNSINLKSPHHSSCSCLTCINRCPSSLTPQCKSVSCCDHKGPQSTVLADQAKFIITHTESLPPFIPPKCKPHNFRYSFDKQMIPQTLHEDDDGLILHQKPKFYFSDSSSDIWTPTTGTSPAVMKKRAREKLRINAAIEDENGHIWVQRQTSQKYLANASAGMAMTGNISRSRDCLDSSSISSQGSEVEGLSLRSDEMPLRTSPSSATLRPRSGKEYRHIDRRVTYDSHSCDSASPHTPLSSGSVSSSVFNFDGHKPARVNDGHNQRVVQSDVQSSHSPDSYVHSSQHSYMNISMSPLSASHSNNSYMNVNMSPPRSPFKCSEHSQPILNYAEIDLTHSPIHKAGVVTMTNEQQCRSRTRVSSVDYAKIDIAATEAVNLASRQHAQSREGSLRRNKHKAPSRISRHQSLRLASTSDSVT